MIEIFNRNENGKDRLIATLSNYHEMFRGLCERDLKAFGYDDNDRTDAPRTWRNNKRIDDFYWTNTRYCYIAVEDGKLVTPDRLVGLFRDWGVDRPYWYSNFPRRSHNYGWNRNAWGSFRAPKSANERRQFAAATVDDDAPPVRCARNPRNLADAWDDRYGHSDRNWKTQSKRQHQWK